MGFRRRVWTNEAGDTVLELMNKHHSRINKHVTTVYIAINGKPLHTKIVEGIFKEAWRRKDFKIPGFHGGADYIRDIRSKMWWEATKSFSAAKRQKGDTKHRRRGPIASWEDPLVKGLGLDWRQQREKATESEWTMMSKDAVDATLRSWNLITKKARKVLWKTHGQKRKVTGTVPKDLNCTDRVSEPPLRLNGLMTTNKEATTQDKSYSLQIVSPWPILLTGPWYTQVPTKKQ